MIGAAGLRGSGAGAAFIRQRLATVPRSTRSISTFQMQRMRMPGSRAQFTPTFSRAVLWKAPAVIGPATIRLNSTLSDQAATPAAEATQSGLPPAFDDLSTLDLAAIPEQIGYLKQLGLDFGWGPAAMMEWAIEHIHLWAGLPWWASIVAVGLVTRALLLKPMLDASDNGAKTHNIKHITGPIRQEMMASMQGPNKNALVAQQKRAELAQIHAENEIKMYKSLVPMLQIPLAFGMFRVVRGMASLPVPGLTNESVLWIQDLTVADPLYVLPVLTSFFLYLTLKRGGEAGMTELMSGPAGKALIYGLPTASFAFMAFVPSALQLYFVSTGFWALCQAYLMHSHAFRRWLGLTIPQRAVPEDDDGSLRLTQNLKAQLEHARKLEQLEQSKAQNVSLIDRTAGAAKDFFNKATGQTGKAADGSSMPPPRFTDAERKKAQEYEKQQRMHDYEELENRNKQRWDAHSGSRVWQKNEQLRKAQWREMEHARDKASGRK